jgi:DNA topoisomerase I
MVDSRNRIKKMQSFLKRQLNNKKKLSRDKNKNKWLSLSHNGLKFPNEYIQKKIPITYDKKDIILDKDSEEAAFLYAKYIGTDYECNSTFNKNFFNDWKKILGKNHEIKTFSLCDFSKMKKYLDDQKEKNKTIEKKEDTSDDKFKTAIVDGKEQSVGNFRVEPPGIFIGRGKNPQLGKIKGRIYPENVTLNIGKNEKVPKPPGNHKWMKVINDRKVEWLASWKDTITGKMKYLWL